MTPPPYFAQWETEALIPRFLDGTLAAEADPLWHRSGARSAAEYARWAHHLCGVASLRMALAALGCEVPTTHALRREVQARGGYVEREGGDIVGLIYQGAVDWLVARGLRARIALDEPSADIPAKLAGGALYIASVHAAIRTPAVEPPQRGGHLVLVFGVDGAGRLRFHNPSGHTPETRRDARLPPAGFARYHAERGIVIERTP